jgi:hypothetical protein
MGLLSKSVIAALAGLFFVSFAPQVSAQDAARDAAIHKCVLEAQATYPDVSNPGNPRNRTDAYKACMSAAGFAP